MKDLIFVIPGILGSRLARKEKEGSKPTPVWDLSVSRLPAALREIVRGELIFTGMGDGPPRDGIVPVGMLEIPQWLPGFFGVDGYTGLVEGLKAHFGHAQVREFPYDWRLSNVYTAQLLKSAAEGALMEWRKASGAGDAKLILVGHSMGGLISRYYCEALGGAPNVRTIVTIGTPHRGSMAALDGIVNGKKMLKVFDLTQEIRSLPSVYELLPIYPCVAIDGQPQPVAEVIDRLPNLDVDSWNRAVAFHDGIRSPAENRAKAGVPCPYEQIVIFSQRQPTLLSASLTDDGVECSEREPFAASIDKTRSGDGTVPWFSALPIEWKNEALAIPTTGKHAAIQTATSVIDLIKGRLKPTDVTRYRGAAVEVEKSIRMRLSTPVVSTEDDLEVEVDSEGVGRITVTLSFEGKESVASMERVLPPGDKKVQFSRLKEGVWRVEAAPSLSGFRSKFPPVTDYVLALSDSA